MSLYKVEICGVNTTELPLLSDKEKKELFQAMYRGDKKARETLVYGNLRLVLSIVQRFSNSGENMDDLFQIGCIGLMKSIDHFDLSLDVKFSTYAVPMIIGEIRRYIRDNNSIRVSRSIRDTAYRVIYAREALSKTMDREPTLQELADHLDMKVEDIVFAMDAVQSPLSLQEPVYTEGGDTLYIMDQVSDKKNREEQWIQEISLKNAVNNLSPREHRIIQMRYFQGKTQMEVAREISISQAQVSRLEKRALRAMRSDLE